MKNYVGRYNDLKNRFNSHLEKLTGLEVDYFSRLNQNDLIELKTVLADVNNLLTLKITISAAYWLCDFFQLDSLFKQEILSIIDDTKPNTNGFDIHIKSPKKIIAEVKCIVPINNGDRFGAAQWNSILDDAFNLKNGKGQFSNTSDYYKFLFLIDLGKRTDSAISQLIKQSIGTSDKPLRANRHKVKEHILLLKDFNTENDITLDKIYIKTIKID